jgi:ABC-type Mn2+/Zn2+ transport system ATPase subunit
VAANFDHAVLLNRRVVAFGRPAEVFTEELLSEAFARHLLVLPGGERTLVGP